MAAPASGSSRRYDVIVVGAGIMGSCAAHAAASRGARVLLLDRFDLLHHRGSSHGESRASRVTYAEAYYPPMVRLSHRLWDEAQRDAGYRVLTPTTHLDLGPRHQPALLAAIANGAATEIPGADAARERPAWADAFRVPDGWTAAKSELGGVIKATKAVAMFQALAVRMGAVVRDGVEVVDIAKNQGEEVIVVRTSSGEEFHGGKCIITVGAWTRKLVKSVTGDSMDLPVQPLHTLICYWKVKPGHEHELAAEAGFPTFAGYGDTHIYSTPSMEYPGLIKICMHGGPQCDPDRRDWAAATGEGEGGLVGPVAQWIDEVMPECVDTAGGPVLRQPCMYSMTPDDDFVIDFLGGEEFGKDVVVGAGFSGHGFKMGPAIGRILAEMALDGEARTASEAGVELQHFRISRFEGNPMGNAKTY
ncbi:probable sarcosine oxidase isoform X1 [Brachypodium distachyon]|nr:probable sarcosine oxidase isoform X1 [Brachypodium distachyon]|eukprot:XP_003578362.3 probable sarcosine oxidase isoform X1 [Brachypodium distachyon]